MRKIEYFYLRLTIVLFAVFPIIPEKIKGLPIIILSLIIVKYLSELKKNSIDIRFFLILSSIFILNLLSIFYNFSFKFPFSKIETSLSLILIPLFFSLIMKRKEVLILKKNEFTLLFIASSSLLSIILLMYFYKLDLFSTPLKVNSFRKTVLEIPFIYAHPIYMSTYFAISILFIIDRIKKEMLNTKTIILYSSSLLVLSSNLLLLSSKGVLISLIISFIFYLTISIRRKFIKYLPSLLIISSFILIIYISPTLERRFREFTIKTTFTKFDINNSTSIRIAIYKCTLKTIKKSPFLGYGWGYSNLKLYNCYKMNNEFLYKKKFNTHNQYFSILLNGGIVALAVFFFFLFYIFKLSYKNKDYFFSSIIVFYLLLFLTENILERQSGLIIFIFIISYFTFINKYNNSDKELKD